MTSRENDAAETPTTPNGPRPALPTLDYRSSPRSHSHAVKNAWPLTFVYWTGSLSCGFLILLSHSLITAIDFAATPILVALGQSTLVASFSTCMFALAISGKTFRSRRHLIRRPTAAAFVLGASVPALMGICVLLSFVLDVGPLPIVLMLSVFALSTVYPMMSAQWLGHHVE